MELCPKEIRMYDVNNIDPEVLERKRDIFSAKLGNQGQENMREMMIIEPVLCIRYWDRCFTYLRSLFIITAL